MVLLKLDSNYKCYAPKNKRLFEHLLGNVWVSILKIYLY